MRVELGLAWGPMRHRPASWLLLALGLAIAAALPVIAAGLRAESTVAAVQQTVAGLSDGRRTVLAVTGRDLRGADLQRANTLVDDGFATAGLGPAERVLAFRPLNAGGADFGLAAVDRLDHTVRLTSGRLPQRCTPTDCEVVAVIASGDSKASQAARTRALAGLGVRATGTATLADQRLPGTGLVTTAQPLLLGSDPDALGELETLTLFGRNRAWLAALDPAAVTARGVPAFTADLARITEDVNAVGGPLSLTWPDAEVTAAAQRAAAAADRFSVLGAGAGVLQLGFALVVAAGMRRRQQLTRRLLSRRGASAPQITLVMAIQPVVAVAAGLILGTVLAAAVVTVRARGLPAGGVGSGGLAVAAAGPTLLGIGVGAVALSLAMSRWPEEAARLTRVVFDLTLVAAAGAAGWLYVISARTPGSPLAASLIVGLALLSGLLAARLWRPAVAGLARLARTRGPVWQLALMAGRRRPLLPMVTAGFLAAACCSVVFAGGFQQCLRQSALDQAAALVPLDVRVSPSAQVAAPLAVLDPAPLAGVAPGVAVHPVVTSPVTAFAGSTSALALPLVGLDPAVLPQLHEYGATTGAQVPAGALAAQLAVPTPQQNGPVIPAAARRLTLGVRGIKDPFTVTLWLATDAGQEQRFELTGSGPTVALTLPDGPARTLRAVELVETPLHLTHRQHAIGEGTTDRQLVGGTIRLGTLSVDGAPLVSSWAGWGSDQATLSAQTVDSVTVRFQLADTRVVLTPGFVPRSALTALPVAVDPKTAARAGARGQFGITANGLAVAVRIVAVMPRLPGVGAEFVLADRSAVTAVLDRTAPGTAAVTQLWISAPGPALAGVRATLESSPAATATIDYRDDLARAIADDPVGTRSIWLLLMAGAVAVLLAMVAAVAQVRAELEESAADHFALELDGLPPSRLRRVLLLRSASIIGVGIPFGVLGGIAITEAAVRLIVTGPGGAAVNPPLRVILTAGGTVVPVLAALLGTALAGFLAAVTSFRDATLSQPELDLR